MCRRADGIVDVMRSSGARARHQQRQHAARTGYELPGHHHNSRRQHGRGQRLSRRMVLGLMARPERLRDRHAFGPGRRRAASVRRTTPASGLCRPHAAHRRRTAAARLPAATRLITLRVTPRIIIRVPIITARAGPIGTAAGGSVRGNRRECGRSLISNRECAGRRTP